MLVSIFLRDYVPLLKRKKSKYVYFDWISFSADNFKRWPTHKWTRTVIKKQHIYSKLHLFAVINEDGLESLQFVRETLNRGWCFFLSSAIVHQQRSRIQRDEDLVVILDNSRLNQSNSIFSFAILNQAKLLFPAPNSVFLNPIELLFCYLKKPLKTTRDYNKFAY